MCLLYFHASPSPAALFLCLSLLRTFSKCAYSIFSRIRRQISEDTANGCPIQSLLLWRIISFHVFTYNTYLHSRPSHATPIIIPERKSSGTEKPNLKKSTEHCILGLTGTYYSVIISLALKKNCVLHRGRSHITTAWRIAPNEINLSLPQLTIGQMQKTPRSLLSKRKETD
jgi:hypothetical protein